MASAYTVQGVITEQTVYDCSNYYPNCSRQSFTMNVTRYLYGCGPQ